MPIAAAAMTIQRMLMPVKNVSASAAAQSTYENTPWENAPLRSLSAAIVMIAGTAARTPVSARATYTFSLNSL
jgi:hypothetical protein